MTARAVEINNFSYSYPASGSKEADGAKGQEKKIFCNFNLGVYSGEWVAVTGRSGCGKSTLICSICGLAQQVEGVSYGGDILLLGKRVEEYSRSELAQTLGVVFQTAQNRIVAPTVEEEIWFGLQNLSIDKQEIIKRTNELIAEMGLEKIRHQNPSALSGGQQQLVSFAAVVAMQPKIYLFDEVMSQLDENNRRVVIAKLQKLNCSGATIIMVEHSKEIGATASRNVALGVNDDRD